MLTLSVLMKDASMFDCHMLCDTLTYTIVVQTRVGAVARPLAVIKHVVGILLAFVYMPEVNCLLVTGRRTKLVETKLVIIVYLDGWTQRKSINC